MPKLVTNETSEIMSAPAALGRSYQLAATGAIVWGFFTLGLLIASYGPSLLGLERQTRASVETLTLVLTVRSVGYLLGSILGGVLLDWYPRRGFAIIGASLVVTSAATAFVPAATTVPALALLMSTVGFSMGTLDTIGNVLLLYLHGEGTRPWMQGLHATFAGGTLCSPLIVRASMALSASGTNLHAAYFTFAACAGLGASFFFGLETPPPREAASVATSEAATATARAGPAGADWRTILVAAALLGLYVGAETGFGGFLLLYATRGPTKMTEAGGQYLTAVYWGFLMVGRVAAIPLSLAVSVSAQLLANVVVCTLGVALLVAGLFTAQGDAASAGRALLWAGAAVYGLGMASVFPSAFMQAEALVDLTGRAASVLMVGSAFGEMAVPLLVGLVTSAWAGGFVLTVGAATLLFSLLAAALAVQRPRQAALAVADGARGVAAPLHELSFA